MLRSPPGASWQQLGSTTSLWQLHPIWHTMPVLWKNHLALDSLSGQLFGPIFDMNSLPTGLGEWSRSAEGIPRQQPSPRSWASSHPVPGSFLEAVSLPGTRLRRWDLDFLPDGGRVGLEGRESSS